MEGTRSLAPINSSNFSFSLPVRLPPTTPIHRSRNEPSLPKFASCGSGSRTEPAALQTSTAPAATKRRLRHNCALAPGARQSLTARDAARGRDAPQLCRHDQARTPGLLGNLVVRLGRLPLRLLHLCQQLLAPLPHPQSEPSTTTPYGEKPNKPRGTQNGRRRNTQPQQAGGVAGSELRNV